MRYALGMSVEEPLPSVWTRPRKGREQPALSRGQIVAEAVRLLDAEGIETLSMRKLGSRLGAGATSLYRHVANKDELIELVVDEVYGEIRAPEVGDPAGWREAAAECARSLRAMILRHPWVGSVLGQVGLSYLGPNAMRLNNEILGVFEAGGFSLAEADQALSVIAAYVIGMSTAEAAWLTMVARSGQDEERVRARLYATARQATQPYPRLAAVFPAEGEQAPDKFEYGLERVLDGLAARPR